MQCQGFNPGLHAFQVSTLPTELHTNFFFFLVILYDPSDQFFFQLQFKSPLVRSLPEEQTASSLKHLHSALDF